MKDYNIHFFSQNPCNIFVNGELVGLIDNNSNFFVDLVVYTDQLIITCEPISNDENLFIPFSFKLSNNNGKVVSSTKNATVVPFPNYHFDVYLTFKKVMFGSPCSVVNKKVGTYNVLALIDKTSSISIFLNDKNVFSTTTQLIQDLEVTTFENLILVYGKVYSDMFLCVFNTKTNSAILCDTYNNIEKNDCIIKTLKHNNITLKTAKVNELNLKTLDQNCYNVFLESYEPINEPKLIPFSFLEAIKQQDFNLAKTFLDETLIDVSTEKMKQYFKNIDSIYYNSYSNTDKYSNYTIIGDVPRNFNFYLSNNKIAEIEEINLF